MFVHLEGDISSNNAWKYSINSKKASRSFYARLLLQSGFALGRVRDNSLPQWVIEPVTHLLIGVPIETRLHESKTDASESREKVTLDSFTADLSYFYCCCIDTTNE